MAARARRGWSRPAIFVLVLACPAAAWAAGLEVPENGAFILARGGTAVALPGTAYGVEFNPATLADVEGLDLHVDARLANNSISFTRAPQINPSNPGHPINFGQVQNSAGTFVAPGIYAAFHPAGWPVAFGVGVFGPPGVGAYSYPDPRNLKKQGYTNDEALAASGQRYSLMSNNNLILLPTLSVSWKIVKWISLGLSLQAASANIKFSQAVAAASNGGNETVDTDAYADLNVSGYTLPIVIPGLLFRPFDGFTIGGQFRPGFQLKMKGTINISGIEADVPITQNTTTAGLTLNQPAEAKLGANYEIGRFSIAVEGVYEQWSAYKQLVLDASSVNVTSAAGTTNLGVQYIMKNWKDTWDARLGASYKILTDRDNGFGLQVHLGGLYETNAISPQDQAIDAVTGNRLGGSAGVTATFHGFGLTLAAMSYLPQHIDIKLTDSNVIRGVSGLSPDQAKQQDNSPVTVGAGSYDANLWVASIGLSYSG